MVKVNFDGAIFSTHSSAGLGMIIRDQAGLVLAALSQKSPLPTSVETVEVIVARRTLLFARELGFERVVVERDSEVVIKAIKEKSLLSSNWGHLLKDIHALSHSFSSIYFLHVKHSGNSVAHSLARRSFCNPLLVWMKFLLTLMMFTTMILVLLMNSFCPHLWAEFSKKKKKKKKISLFYIYIYIYGLC